MLSWEITGVNFSIYDMTWSGCVSTIL